MGISPFPARYAAAMDEQQQQQIRASLFLKEKAEEWLPKYKQGLLWRKRLDLYTGMKGFAE
jgi:hypothetical protein